jgi:diaminopimelate decarboxylase
VTAAELLSRYGSPLWLADVDRFSSNLERFAAAWCREWPEVQIRYSYKTNRLLAFLHAAELGGAGAEVVCEAEYVLATAAIEVDPARIVVDGPANPDSLLARAGAGGALVLADCAAELDRAAARGVERIGLRVAIDSFTGTPTRFGIPPAEIPAAAWRAAWLGLTVEALSSHLVSTDFERSMPTPNCRRLVRARCSWHTRSGPTSSRPRPSSAARDRRSPCPSTGGGEYTRRPRSWNSLWSRMSCIRREERHE